MKFEFIILSVTTFIIYNTYHDNYYSKQITVNHKYFKMISYGFIGLSLYIFFKRKPDNKKTMVTLLTDIVKYMPIDKNTTDMLTPILDFSSQNMFEQVGGATSGGAERRIINSGKTSNKRSVSETKKKFVASNQNWKCNSCKQQLTAWFEVHHTQPLEHGGSNHVDNLEALCRNCHGEKTALDNL